MPVSGLVGTLCEPSSQGWLREFGGVQDAPEQARSPDCEHLLCCGPFIERFGEETVSPGRVSGRAQSSDGNLSHGDFGSNPKGKSGVWQNLRVLGY